jgi:hypothetical protein
MLVPSEYTVDVLVQLDDQRLYLGVKGDQRVHKRWRRERLKACQEGLIVRWHKVLWVRVETQTLRGFI